MENLTEESLTLEIEKLFPFLDVDKETPKSIRKKLEVNLNLPPNTLDSWKQTIREILQDIMTRETKEESMDKDEQHSKNGSESESESEENEVSNDSSNNSMEESTRRPLKKRKLKSTKKKTSLMDSSSKSNKGLESLKQIAKAAGVLGPSLLKSLKECLNDDERETILRNKMEDTCYSFKGKYPSKSEIALVKKKKDLERELDGIDTSLILKEPRKRTYENQRMVSLEEKNYKEDDDSSDSNNSNSSGEF